jgi:hypothetical protein
VLTQIGRNLAGLKFTVASGAEFSTTVIVATNNLELVKGFDLVATVQVGALINNDKHAYADAIDRFTHLRVLLVLNDRGILARSN